MTRAPLFLLLAGIGAFYALTLQAGHDWRDDFALFLLHAENLASGRPYADTGFLFSLLETSPSPAAYPPVFPALLAPAVALFGLDLAAFKLEILLLFLAGLYFMARLFERDIPRAAAWSVVALVGFNPVFWDFRNQVYSDLPFLAACYGALLLMRRSEAAPAGGASYGEGALIGAACYLAYGMRVLGATLMAAFVAAELARGGWKSRRLRAALPAFLLPAALQAWLIPGTEAYALHVREYFDRAAPGPLLARQAVLCARLLEKFWENLLFAPASAALTVLLSALALRGFWSRLRRGAGTAEAFFALYCLACLLFPLDGLRHLFPAVPLFLYYAYLGARSLPWPRPEARRSAALCLGALLLLSYAGKYAVRRHRGSLRLGPLPEGVETRAARELFAFVRERTAPDDVFVFRKPRALALYARRRSAILPHRQSDAVVWDYLKSIRASYLVAGSVFPDDPVAPFVSRSAGRARPVYSNPGFTVYRISR
jgi:hypothetical protein